ncbi:MAG: VanZ family protein [Chitinophagales bacterium]|nr:VanZ family protein [Chitinophagales bacterium]
MRLIKNFSIFLTWLLIIFYLSFAPLRNWPQEDIFQKLYIDKLVHITMYSLLSFFLLIGFFRQQKNQPLRYRKVAGCIIFCIIVGVSIEFLQPVLTMYRKFEFMDMVANALGSIAGLYLFKSVLNKKWIGLGVKPADH